MKTIVTWNMKGGTGKTTVAMNLAYGLAEKGSSVLCIDLDGQCNLTSFFEPSFRKGQKPNIAEIIEANISFLSQNAQYQKLSSGICQTRYPQLDVIKGSESTQALEDDSVKVLEQLLITLNRVYDYAVIDCHPDFGWGTQNALAASDLIIVPILLDGFSRDNLNLVIHNLLDLENRIGRDLQFQILANRVRNLKSQQKMYEDITMRHDYPLLDSCITDSAVVGSSLVLKNPVVCHRSKSIPAKDYTELVDEVCSILGRANHGEF